MLFEIMVIMLCSLFLAIVQFAYVVELEKERQVQYLRHNTTRSFLSRRVIGPPLT